MMLLVLIMDDKVMMIISRWLSSQITFQNLTNSLYMNPSNPVQGWRALLAKEIVRGYPQTTGACRIKLK